MDIFTSLNHVALDGAPVFVSGVKVLRSSLFGFDLLGWRGLTIKETTALIESTVAVAGQVVTVPTQQARRWARTKYAPTFFAKVIDAVKPYLSLGAFACRRSPSTTGRDRVIVLCSAGKGVTGDQHMRVAQQLARALRNDGHMVDVDGCEVQVFADAA